MITSTGEIVTPIHYTHLVNGEWSIACMPALRELHQTPQHPAYQRTDAKEAVTCPACKRLAK